MDDFKQAASFEFFVRDVCNEDIDDIYKLGALLNTINLPANKNELEQVIALSERSFSLEESDTALRRFLFALVDRHNRVRGVSQILAQHGTLSSPHTYFQINIDERYSPTLNKYFRHHTLKLCQNFAGPTEIGSLILAKEYRSHPENLGRQLSFVRFLFMAMNRSIFRDHVLAELMPPLGPNFASALWNAIGYQFTGLDYATADMLSRKNKEFIKSLFPAGDIYVNLLPSTAQEVIGKVGPESLGAAHMLSTIGFRYSLRVDPFDGGPHFEAAIDDIVLIDTACHAQVSMLLAKEKFRPGLIGYFRPKMPSGERFRASRVSYYYDLSHERICVNNLCKNALDLDQSSELWAIDLFPTLSPV